MKNQVIGSQQLRHLVEKLNALTIPTDQRYVHNLPGTRLEQGANLQIRIDAVH
ncbi:hypothetical protein DESUT3_33680 [Desulfuromonas versatilis]|uniref:Uncharacterized protein n=1 Tax=Desulfuromonas versatilis TaxID=2802975 RepID=A0ABM8HWG6_9BACT|nr:hypothetical protein [Desulfuromonas versatilis]BCR06299.1 hypothetical protein DESUT3_33680 [Desulfuromonas versatilis]